MTHNEATFLLAMFAIGCVSADEPSTDDVIMLDNKADQTGTLVQLSPTNPRAYAYHRCESADGCVFDVAVMLQNPTGCTFFHAQTCGLTDPNFTRTVGKFDVDYAAGSGSAFHDSTKLVVLPTTENLQVIGGHRVESAEGEEGWFTLEQDQNVVYPTNVTPVRVWNALIVMRPVPKP